MYTIRQLIEKTSQELLDSGLSANTVQIAYRPIWNHLSHKYGDEAIFQEEMVLNHCMDHFQRDIYSIDSRKLSQMEKRYIVAFRYLIQCSKDIPIAKNSIKYKRDFVLSERSQILLNGYLEKCKNNGNSHRTLRNKEREIKNFLIDSDFDHITKESCLEYLKNKRNSVKPISYSVQMGLIFHFLIYCYESDDINKDLITVWPKQFPNVKNKSIPSTYSVEEIRTLLEESKSYAKGHNHLRDYAILCLIAYTGIRCVDVCNLTFNCFDWIHNTITIIQQKNSKQIVFPLIPEIGNPIIGYITSERNSSELKNIFVSQNGKKMDPRRISHIIENYFSASSIEIGDRHYSAHALRHSLATNLINHSVPVFIIANTLGHSNLDSVHIYAKVNLDGLRKCVLEVPCNA